MSSTNKTSLGLNQWDATDQIQRVDFNKDNEIINEVLERKADLDDVDEELEKKVSKDTSITWHDLELLNGFAKNSIAKYSKDNNGWVQITGAISRSSVPTANEQIVQLPVGFRPSEVIPINFIQACGESGHSWATYGWITPSGSIQMTSLAPPVNDFRPHVGISLVACYKAAL